MTHTSNTANVHNIITGTTPIKTLIKPLEEQTIKDNFLFEAVMKDGDNCKQFIELGLGKKISLLRIIDSEKSIFYRPEYHGVRLDVYVEDDAGASYNIEMQVSYDSTELRARYYHSQMDMELLLSGHDYDELPDTYVIFICDYDPLQMGKFVYTIESKCKELPEYEYHDGVHTIFLSTKGRNRDEVSPEIIKFLEYVHADLPDSMRDFKSEYVRRLQDSVGKIKDDRDRRAEYMTTEVTLRKLYKDGQKAGEAIGEARGVAIGEATGIANTLAKYLLRNPSADTAADIFDVPVERIRQIAADNGIVLK